jgi:hypothetical protein
MARRKYDAATAEQWTLLLTLGDDWFGDLEPQWTNASLHRPVKLSEAEYRAFPAIARPKPEDQAFLAAAKAAWRQYGPHIMAKWNRATHRPGERQLPEAFIRFGDPAKL